jgi:hypothetical protein
MSATDLGCDSAPLGTDGSCFWGTAQLNAGASTAVMMSIGRKKVREKGKQHSFATAPSGFIGGPLQRFGPNTSVSTKCIAITFSRKVTTVFCDERAGIRDLILLVLEHFYF